MKRVVSFLFLLPLVLPVFAPMASAQTTTDNNNVSTFELSPFNLASLAYRGRLDDQGVPGYGSLESGVNSGAITAEDVIQAAIDSGRLAESIRDDHSYTVSLQHQLDVLIDRDTR